MEEWKIIEGFPKYAVSNEGYIRSERTGRILALSINQYGVVCVGLMRDGRQCHRSVPRLVARAFISAPDNFDTPINIDGDRENNEVFNLAWRPRWFAVKYNRQFFETSEYSIDASIRDRKTGEVSKNSFEAAKRYGLLEDDLVLSILNRTYVWPTYQEFEVVEE